jgi:hypothetical protein
MLQRTGRTADSTVPGARKSIEGLIEPCLPSPAKAPPSGPDWLHEIKHDGFRSWLSATPLGSRVIHCDRAAVRAFGERGSTIVVTSPVWTS